MGPPSYGGEQVGEPDVQQAFKNRLQTRDFPGRQFRGMTPVDNREAVAVVTQKIPGPGSTGGIPQAVVAAKPWFRRPLDPCRGPVGSPRPVAVSRLGSRTSSRLSKTASKREISRVDNSVE